MTRVDFMVADAVKPKNQKSTRVMSFQFVSRSVSSSMGYGAGGEKPRFRMRPSIPGSRPRNAR